MSFSNVLWGAYIPAYNVGLESRFTKCYQNCMPFEDLALCQALICLQLAQKCSWSYCEHKSVPRHGPYTVRCTIWYKLCSHSYIRVRHLNPRSSVIQPLYYSSKENQRTYLLQIMYITMCETNIHYNALNFQSTLLCRSNRWDTQSETSVEHRPMKCPEVILTPMIGAAYPDIGNCREDSPVARYSVAQAVLAETSINTVGHPTST